MGLDQSVYVIKAREGLKDFYRFGDEDIPEDLKDADDVEELYLRKEYAVQEFMFELSKKKGATNENEFYGSLLRVTAEDVKELHKLAESPEKLKEYSGRWREPGYDYDEWSQDRVRKFCRMLMQYVAFDDYAAYYESDW